MAAFAVLVVVAAVLMAVGGAAHGLLYILAVGVLVLLADLVWLGVVVHRRWQRPQR